MEQPPSSRTGSPARGVAANCMLVQLATLDARLTGASGLGCEVLVAAPG